MTTRNNSNRLETRTATVLLQGLDDQNVESDSLFSDGREGVAEAELMFALDFGDMVVGGRG